VRVVGVRPQRGGLIDLIPYIVIGLLLVAVPLTAAAAVVKHRRDKAAEKAPLKVAEAAPVTAPPPPDGPRCPCGAPATRPLPRARVWEVPLLGRLITRQRDAFGEAVVCDSHSDVADTVIDERIAEARLADARAQRDKITALANGADVLGTVVGTLPEDKQKAYARSLRPMPTVRALPRTTDDGAEEKTG